MIDDILQGISVKETLLLKLSEQLQDLKQNGTSQKFVVKEACSDEHMTKIAKKTLKMSDTGAMVMGGMTKDEARKHLAKVGHSAEEIAKLEEDCVKHVTEASKPRKIDIYHNGKYLWSTNKHMRVIDAVKAAMEHLSNPDNVDKIKGNRNLPSASEALKHGVNVNTIKGYFAESVTESDNISEGGMFSTAKVMLSQVPPEHEAFVKKMAKKHRGRIETYQNKHGKDMRITFNDRFPDSFASHDSNNFKNSIKHLNIGFDTGMGMQYESVTESDDEPVSISIEHHHNGITLSAMHNDRYHHQIYNGYTKKEAIQHFKANVLGIKRGKKVNTDK
jgi:hypothetical protein